MNRTKLAVATLLLVAMLLQPAPAVVEAESPFDGNVSYYRVTLTDPVMNKAIIDTALTKFIKANNDSEFNLASEFIRTRASGSAESPDRLVFGTTFRHKNDSNTYNVEYGYRIPSSLDSALHKGDLQVSLTANLTNDKHWNIDRHLSSWTAYPTTWIQTWSKILQEHDTDAYNSDTTKTMGKHAFVPIPTDPWGNWLLFGALGQVCTCGSSKVSNISIILADTVGPRVTSITANRRLTDGSLQPHNGFRPGEIVYITMQFDESIRFANDSAMPIADAPKLKLELRGATDNVLKATPAEASLISLNRDTLTFAYQVPDNYQIPEGTVSVNHYVSAIAPYLDQTSWNSSEPVFDLKLFDHSGYLSYQSKTTSKIVDLAGNPLDIGRSVSKLQSAVYLDGTIPTVKAISVAGKQGATGNETSVDQVFARVGDYLGFFVDFSEDLAFVRKSDGRLTPPDRGYLQDGWIVSGAKHLGLIGSEQIELLAELNVTADGKPLTAVAQYAQSVRDKHGATFWRVYFSTPQRTGYDMAPLVYPGGEMLPIGINRIYMGDRWSSSQFTLTDCRGNAYDQTKLFINAPTGSRLMPAEQLWLDFTKPVAATSLTASGGSYKPLTYGVDTNATAFCFPIRASDVEVASEKHASGTNGVIGYFMWRDVQDMPPPYTDKYPFEYAVTSSAERPPDGAYQAAMTYGKYPFTQVDDVGNYLHVRFADGVDYNFASSQLVVYPRDNANNQGEASFQLDFTVDRRKPQITQTRSSTQCYGNNQGWIYTTIRFTDVSAIASAEYQWTTAGAAPSGDWVPVTSYGTGTNGRYRTMSFSLERGSLLSGQVHNYSLYVRGTDAVGYQSDTARFDFRLDLRYPSFGQEFVTNPEQPNGQHSLLISAGGGDKRAEVVWVLVKQPLENHPQYPNTVWYWRKVVNVSALGGGAVDVLAIDDSGSGWEECEVWLNSTMWRDDPKESPWTACTHYIGRGLGNKQQFLQYMQRYSPLQIEVIARPNWKYYLTDLVFWDENYLSTKYTLNYASDKFIGQNDVINRITIAASSLVSPTGYDKAEVLPGSPDGLALPRSLDGAMFSVSLANARYGAYGLNDIDFESEETMFTLYETGEGASLDPVFSAKLVSAATQTITIPTGVANRGGSYKVVVTVKAKGSPHVDRKEYADILIDRRQLTSYGVARVTTSQALGGAEVQAAATTDYAVAADERASTVYVSASPDVEQTVLFMAQANPLNIGGAAHSATYLQVWNETAADQLGAAAAHPWIHLPAERAYRTVLLTDASKVGILANLSSSSATEAAVIPILPGENVIKYRLALAGGYQTPEQTLLVQAGVGQPTIRMQLTPDLVAGQTTNSDLTARVAQLESPLVDPDTLQLGVLGNSVLTTALQQDRRVTLHENGEYCFYAYDKFHSFGYQQVKVDSIDRNAPKLTVQSASLLAASSFQVTLQLQDNLPVDGCKLFLQYDQDYAALLGVEPETAYAVPLIDGWAATVPDTGGLFSVSVNDLASGARAVAIRGSFKHDARDGAPAEAERRIRLYAVDAAGNRSGEESLVDGVLTWAADEVGLTVQNLPTVYVGGNLGDGGFVANFSRPLILSKPGGGSAASAYALAKRGLPFYTNGKYQVEGVDIFGESYSGEILVTQFDALYACGVSVSDLAPTNRDVTVVLNAAFNLNVSLVLPESISGGTITPVTNANGTVVGARIVMSSNGIISYQVKPNDSAFPARTCSLAVENIDKTAPEVSLDWVYSADVVSGKTAGEVIVSLAADEALQALDGSGTMHVFTLHDQQPHVFRYADLAGNEGSVTAVLPVTITEKTAAVEDKAAPDYELAVYRSERGVSSKVAGYTKADYEAIPMSDKADAFPLFSGMLQLRFQIYDASQTELSLAGVPDGSTAVSLSGTTVTVSDNLNFSVVLRDSVGNETTVPISIAHADNTAPEGSVSYVRTAPFVIRGYLEMSDAGGGPVSLKNSSGVQIETTPDGTKYYHEFRDNESFTFLFADAAGNLGSTVAVVSSLDMNPPSGTITQWVPHYIDAAGVAHPGVLSNRPTNSDVSVYLQFDRAIKSLSTEIQSGSAGDVSVSQTEDSATVVFRQNATVKLTGTGLNGRSSSLSLAVNIIDKLPPVITASQTASDYRSATYTFLANEPVTFEQGDDVSQPGTTFQRAFDLNGDYTLRFWDLAGNATTKQVTVNSIDRTPPSLTVTGLPGVGAPLQKQAVVFSASMNEAGTISFRGVSYSVSAGQVRALTVDYNGTYELVATDRAGLVTRHSFTVNCIDRVAPQLILPAGGFLIRQGASLADLETVVKEQVQVFDNADSAPKIFVFDAYEWQLSSPGELTIRVLAEDAAKNQTTLTATLRIYAQNELQVRVNGLLARQNSTLFVGGKGSRLITVTLENAPTGDGGPEPYRIYWRKGLCTAGQMKYGASLEDGSFTAPEDGFYTIYVVTQSRASYLTHIYLEQ